MLADKTGLGKTLATLSLVIPAYQQAKEKDLGRDSDDEVPKVDKHSEEKGDSCTNPDSPSLLSSINRTLGHDLSPKQLRSRRFRAILVLPPTAFFQTLK